MALITLVDRITEALDNGDYVVGVFLDFSKAFDTVDHAILLDKMFIYGIRAIALQWFKDYLTGRSQYVTYNGCKSNNSEINCGVPLGSILGTLLFPLYQWFSISVRGMFFDSICRWLNMFISGKDVQVISEKLNSDMGRISGNGCVVISFR